MSLARLSVRNPVAVNLLVIFIVLAGAYLFTTMTREVFPDIPFGLVRIVTVYPGVSAEDMEEQVTAKIEEEIADVEDVDQILSFTSEGQSSILVEMDPRVTNTSRVLQDIQTGVDRAKPNLPPDAEDPIVKEQVFDLPVINVAITGSSDENVLREAAEDLAEEIRNIPGVGSITIVGTRERQVWVEVDADRLYAYRLGLTDVVQAVAASNVNLPAGTLRGARGEEILRTIGQFTNLSDIERVIVRSTGEGRRVLVRDLGRVTDAFEDERTRGRLDAARAVNLQIRKKSAGNAILIAQRIRDLLTTYTDKRGANLTFSVNNDTSKFILRRLNLMRNNGLIGFGLVLGLLFLFLGARPAGMAALGIPVSILGAIILMYAFGITINLMSLFALILVLGMLVDDAIVVVENAYRHIEEGMDVRQAAILGTEEVQMPVVAAVSTTAAAFLPLLLMTGIMGKFLGSVPKVVTFALGVSLIEALFVLPSHVAEWTGRKTARRLAGRGPRRRPPRLWFRKLQDAYTYVLIRALRHRVLVVLGVLVLAAASIVIAVEVIPLELFHGRFVDVLTVRLKTGTESTLDQTQAMAERLEEVATDMPPGWVEAVITNVGFHRDRQTLSYGTNLAEMYIDLADAEFAPRGFDHRVVIDRLRAAAATTPGIVSSEFDVRMGGPPQEKPVFVRVRGEALPVLRTIADQIKAFLRTIEGVTDIKDDLDAGKPEQRVVPDEEKARQLNLTTTDVARAVRTAFEGQVATKYRPADEEIDLVVKYAEQDRRNVADVLRLRVATPAGPVPLASIAQVIRVPGTREVRRVDRKRTITVTADVDTDLITAHEANRRLKEHFKDISRQFPGYALSYEGEESDIQESLSALGVAFVAAAIIIYAIIGTLFKSFLQPVVVMSVVPFCFIGVVFGIFIQGTTLNLLGLMGVVALIGIVVNDSLVMVEFINRRRREGQEMFGAIVEAARIRLRPILLTSLTTIFGLMPLAYLAKGQAQMLSPLAQSIVWGLTFSTVLTLFVIPCVYANVERLRLLATRGSRALLRAFAPHRG